MNDKEKLEEIKKNSYGTLLEIAKYVLKAKDSRGLIHSNPIMEIITS